MNTRLSFSLFDASGNPLVDATPTITIYRKADGTVASPTPMISNKGEGFYEFSIDPEENGAVAYLVDCGINSAVPYMMGSLGELLVFAMYDGSGTLNPSATPAFISYSDGVSSLTPPNITNLTGGMFGFIPVTQPLKLIQYVVGDSVNKYSGTIGNISVANPSPLPDTEITNTTTIAFDVVDTECFLGRVLIAVKYAAMSGATELAWDGSSAISPFQVTVTPITNGYRYSILRTGGWPAAPTIRHFITNYGGREL